MCGLEDDFDRDLIFQRKRKQIISTSLLIIICFFWKMFSSNAGMQNVTLFYKIWGNREIFIYD